MPSLLQGARLAPVRSHGAKWPRKWLEREGAIDAIAPSRFPAIRSDEASRGSRVADADL